MTEPVQSRKVNDTGRRRGAGGTQAVRMDEGESQGAGGRPAEPLAWWRRSTWKRLRLAGRPDLRWSAWLFQPLRTLQAWWNWRPVPARERRRHNESVTRAAAVDELTRDLDEGQQAAAVCFEDRTVITAGAGSGKTRTMVARARWAVHRLGTPSERIAFVTFTRAAAKEIRERTPDLPNLAAGTIHHLARRLLEATEGRTPQLNPLAENGNKALFLERIREWLAEAYETDPLLAAALEVRRQAVRRRGRDEGRRSDSGCEVADLVEDMPLRIPPGGERVKSYGEFAVGTLLDAAGVPYRYEAEFPLRDYRTGAERHDLRSYRPDFYLPDDPAGPVTADGGVWLEHYAHDRNDDPPAGWADYDATRTWKREVHRRAGTRYVETCFGDLEREWAGGKRFFDVVAERLTKAGVSLPPRSGWKRRTLPGTGTEEEDGGKDGAESGDELTARVCEEIRRWIVAGRQEPQGVPRKRRGVEAGSLALLARPVLRAYEAELKRTGTTDYEGMVLEGIRAARSHPEGIPWDHVLVDEYQDVNPAQAAFVHALRAPSAKRPDGATLAVVGDERQAIFGFQGGDPELIRTMCDPGRGPGERKPEPAVPMPLARSYRFGQRLADAAEEVVEQRIRGRMRGMGPDCPAGRTAVTIAQGSIPGRKGATKGATAAAAHMLKAWIGRPETKRTVLVMARRRVDVDDPAAGREDRAAAAGIERARLDEWATGRNLELAYATIHRAKGREADYALLLDAGPVRAGRQAKDQALLRALGQEDSADEEEARLWYVALTRARLASAVLVLDRAPAPAEPTCRLLAAQRSGLIEQDPDWLEGVFAPLRIAPACPACNPRGTGPGRLVRRQGRNGGFTACTEWSGGDGPRSCGYRQPNCPVCEEGLLRPRGADGRAVCEDCGARVPLCDCTPPTPMRVRVNRRTEERFFGCANYPHSNCRGKPYNEERTRAAAVAKAKFSARFRRDRPAAGRPSR